MNWWQYLLLVNLYLVLFYGFYALLLRRETFFQLNRIYLISSALLSFFIPLIQAGWVQNLFITQTVEYTIYSNTIVIHNFKPVKEVPVNLGEVLANLYVAGIVILALRLIVQLIALNRIIKLPEQAAAYSFFKKIKLDAELNADAAIAAHEQVHAKQWHSADVMIMEAVMIVNWFNPVVYFYRRAIKHIHEFIADRNAVKSAANKSDYALLLVTQSFNAPQHHLVNHFFTGTLLKQRIIMLQKNKSHRISLLKYGLSAPLFMLMLVLSSATVNNSKVIQRVNIIAQKVFKEPVVIPDPSVIKNDASAKKTVMITLLADNSQNKLTGATRKQDAAIDTAIRLETGSARTYAVIRQLPGLTLNSSGSITAQGSQVTRVRVNGLDLTTDSSLFTAVEVQPRFAGFSDFMAKNIVYPADARQQKIEGKVIVGFIVEKDGSVSNVKLIRSLNKSLGDEAIRVVSMSPKWTPGYQNGHVVRVQLTVPVGFSLANNTAIMTGTAVGDSTKKSLNLTLGSSQQPLYIVDGKEIRPESISLISPDRIESITVLKNQRAKKYGIKGLNGVVLITTKKSSTEKIKNPVTIQLK